MHVQYQFISSEAALHSCSDKKDVLKIAAKLQDNIHAKVQLY